MRVPANIRIGRRNAFSRIHDQQRYVRCLQMLAAHNHAQLFCQQLGLALASNACRVDKPEAMTIALHYLIHRIASGSRNWRNNRPIAPRQRIQQSALAHIRPSDNRNLRLPQHMLAMRAQFAFRPRRSLFLVVIPEGNLRSLIPLIESIRSRRQQVETAVHVLFFLFLDAFHYFDRLFVDELGPQVFLRIAFFRQHRPNLVQKVANARTMLR